jgi:endothelin-converting enzyme/putative endopeptidase
VKFSLRNLDLKADPCVDFYQYACGGWIDANPLPGDEVFWDTTAFLQRWNESILHDSLNKAQGNDPGRSVVQRVIGDYYAACMDEKQIEVHGREPIQPELDRIAAIKDMRDLAVELGRLHRILFRITDTISSVYASGSGQPLWGVSSLPDFNNASLTLAVVDQGGLGLPDRDYYLRDDPDSIQVRKHYLEHIQKTLELAETTSLAPPRLACSKSKPSSPRCPQTQ